MTIQEIYNILNAYAPFSLQESWDRSGLLCGDPAGEVQRVLLTLDITMPVVEEAAACGCQLILAHHPVIWDPLRTVTPKHPVWHLVKHNIGAICAHTCLDIAEGGLNDYIGEMMAPVLGFASRPEPFVHLDDRRALGRTAALSNTFTMEEMAERLLAVFGCQSLRYYQGNDKPIARIAWCSGSGGDLLADAAAAGADALITGDCKHSVWAEAQNLGMNLFDCEHFSTEVPVTALFRRILQNSAPELELFDAQTGTRPFYTAVTERKA